MLDIVKYWSLLGMESPRPTPALQSLPETSAETFPGAGASTLTADASALSSASPPSSELPAGCVAKSTIRQQAIHVGSLSLREIQLTLSHSLLSITVHFVFIFSMFSILYFWRWLLKPLHSRALAPDVFRPGLQTHGPRGSQRN